MPTSATGILDLNLIPRFEAAPLITTIEFTLPNMARQKKRYTNRQSRGNGTQPKVHSDTPKDYYRMSVQHHGGDMALEAFLEKFKKS